MIQKIKEFIIGCITLLILLFVIVCAISSFRSTHEIYVCSGSHFFNGQHTQVNLKFEIENQYPGNSWKDNPTWTMLALSDYHDGFYFSSLLNKGSDDIIRWNTTYYGKNMSVYAYKKIQQMEFDFQTKILEVTKWDTTGNIKVSEYNLLCKEVK